MDTDVTEEQRALLDVSVRFMEGTYPLRAVRDGAYRDDAVAVSYRRQAAELGWFSMLVPEELGGGSASGNGIVDAALIAYKRGGTLQPGSFVGTNVVAHALAVAGSEEQQTKVLPALLSGERSASWAVTAAGERSRLDGGMQAETAGAGYRLWGAKTFVQDVDETSWLLVTGTTGDGPSQFLLAAATPGVTVTSLESLDVSRRFAEVRFDGVEVPGSALVGAPGEAADLVWRQLAIASVLTVAESVGTMDREFEFTVDYAKERIAFGRPIGSFQAIKHLLADTSLDLEMSKAVAVLAAARSLGVGDEYGAAAASMAKAFVGDCCITFGQSCFQVFGGIGYTWEHDQHLYLRRLTTDASLFGDPAWHREHLCQLAGI